MKEVSFKVKENSKGKSRVRGIRVDRGSILDEWWDDTTHASSIAREVLTAFILNQYYPQENINPNKKHKTNKTKTPKRQISEEDLENKIENFLGNL